MADEDGDGQGTACDLDDGIVNEVWLGGGAVLGFTPEEQAVEYNVYRVALNALSSSHYGACYLDGIQTTTTAVPEDPPPTHGYGYLITAVMAGGEGSLGFDSGGTERPNNAPCP